MFASLFKQSGRSDQEGIGKDAVEQKQLRKETLDSKKRKLVKNGNAAEGLSRSAKRKRNVDLAGSDKTYPSFANSIGCRINTNENSQKSRRNKKATQKNSQLQLKPKNNAANFSLQSALELSSKLQDLSTKKKLREALDCYWDTSNAEIRDGHHASIMVNCCSRCGAVEVR